VAEAMDCELIYSIRPIKKKSYSQIIWEKLLPAATKKLQLKRKNVFINKFTKRGPLLATIAKDLMNDSSFRKEQGWSERKNFCDQQ